MPSSAISFNTAGLATATSPGLVGTGAQTFAGKKTLDGGALIKGDTSGVAIAAGYVGQVVRDSGFNGSLSSASGCVGVSNLSIGSGIWLISCSFYGLPSGAAAASLLVNTVSATSVSSLPGYISSSVLLTKRDNDNYISATMPTYHLNVSNAATVIYFNINRNNNVSITDVNYSFTAVRIA